MLLSLLAVLDLAFLLSSVFGFSWNYPVAPRQCSTFTVVVNGSDVVFPLKILIVPVGQSPLSHEVRKVMEVPFPANATTVDFQLPYPASSKFVGLVTDASGYSGNASTWTVLQSQDSSCFDASQNAVPAFTFKLSPTEVAECRDVGIFWNPSNVQGVTYFLSVIPDGEFRPIPQGKVETDPLRGTGFTWRPPVRARTNLIFVGGDNRGMGSGGFVSTVVYPGDSSRDEAGACLPPSQTPTPSSPGPNIGAIVGGVVGGFVLLGLIIFAVVFCLIRKKRKPKTVEPATSNMQLYAPAAAGPFAKPLYYDASPPPPNYPPTPREPGWNFVGQEYMGGQLPMQVTYSDNTGTTAISRSSGLGEPQRMHASPPHTTPQGWGRYDSPPPPWDGH